VNHDALDVGPRVEKLRDFSSVILHKKNVGRLATLGKIIEVQSKHRREARRDPSGRSIRVRDRNADLFTARLISLGLLA
jgi:predicted RNA polymerase sigma factor